MPFPSSPATGRRGRHGVLVILVTVLACLLPYLGVAPQAAAATAHDPVSHLDGVTASGTSVRVRGWAFDRDSSSPIRVHVYVDGKGAASGASSVSRPDVRRAYGLSRDALGFDTRITVAAGTHNVCAYAINIGAGSNQRIGCRTIVVSASGAASSSTTSSTSSSSFKAGNIISDAEFFKAGSMTATQIRSWLQARNPSCVSGPDGSACLKSYTATTTTMDTAYCAPYTGAKNEDAASIIAKASTACGINPKVLLVILQKEQGLVLGTGSGLTATRYSRATGFQCPDNSACDATYAGLPSQLYYAASRLVQYGAQPASFRFRAGGTYSIAYNPNAACGSSTVTIANRATAALYNYTPYQPNAAALSNLYGTGDSCSSYGNRNFWRYYRTWFGSTGV